MAIAGTTVTPADVAVTLMRPAPTPLETAAWTMWIADAARKIKKRLGDVPFSLLDQDDLDYVVREAVAAKAANPDGKLNERIDDYSYGLAGVVSREVNITDEWWDMLAPRPAATAYSVSTSPRPDL